VGTDRLEAFAQTLTRADERRLWLEQLARDAVNYRTREISDPLADLGASEQAFNVEENNQLPPELAGELIQEVLTQHYRLLHSNTSTSGVPTDPDGGFIPR
jgi:hypothetical protein